VPFVQGQLSSKPLTVTVTTECAHCHQPLHLELDGELNYRVVEADAQPLIFAPMVDFAKLGKPSIIDDF
jgi:uncharacterized metal-binding protein YceD (DUF177 family)